MLGDINLTLKNTILLKTQLVSFDSSINGGFIGIKMDEAVFKKNSSF